MKLRGASIALVVTLLAVPALGAPKAKMPGLLKPAVSVAPSPASTPEAVATDAAATPTAAAIATPVPPKDFPGKAIEFLPKLVTQVKEVWPELKMRSVMAAQIEQETCISLKSKGCWNPKTELKTSREYGFGLGQITIAYKADGTERFNTFTELKKLDEKLASWKFEDRYDPDLQIRALVLMNKDLSHKIRFDTADETEKMAFLFSAYNGGIGGILQDRQLCKEGCDRSKWFGNVAKNSFKSKIKVAGYSTSFFDVNRCYVRNILLNRRAKYAPYTQGELDMTTDPASGSKPWEDGEKCADYLPGSGGEAAPATGATAAPASTATAVAAVTTAAAATQAPTQKPTATEKATPTPKATATEKATPTPKATATEKSTPTPKPSATEKPAATPAAAAAGADWAADAKACTKLENRECTDAGDSFKIGDTVFIYVKATAGPAEGGEVHVVWFLADKKMSDSPLKISQIPWRTNSKRLMGSGSKGDWKVEVRAPGGAVLQTLSFAIK